MKNLSKRTIVYIGLFIIIFAIGFSKVYMKYYNSDKKIMSDVSKYMVEENGERYFNLEKAKKDRVREKVINLGNLVNDLADVWEFRNLEETEDNNVSKKVIYGNFCGKDNNGWDKNPIDDLDAACKGFAKCSLYNKDNTGCSIQFCKELDWVIEFAQDGSRKKEYAMALRVLFGYKNQWVFYKTIINERDLKIIYWRYR